MVFTKENKVTLIFLIYYLNFFAKIQQIFYKFIDKL